MICTIPENKQIFSNTTLIVILLRNNKKKNTRKNAIMLSFKLDSPSIPTGIYFGFCGMKLKGIL